MCLCAVRFFPRQVISGFVWLFGGIISMEEEQLLGKVYPGASFHFYIFIYVCLFVLFFL